MSFDFLQVFAMLNLTPYDLSVDRLDVHAVSAIIIIKEVKNVPSPLLSHI